jgi:threonine synthase
VAEEEIGPEIAALAETTGVFGETATGVTLGALREAVRLGEVTADDRVVLLVTGDGLKTPSVVAEAASVNIVPIAADADALLDSLAAAV